MSRIVVGVISDTHGPLSAEAARALDGVDRILHAGDVMDPTAVLDLQRIAPTTAVKGNMDGYEVSKALDLSPTALVEIGGVFFYVLHDVDYLDLDPVAAGVGAVIHGHLHRAVVAWRDGVLYLNPGSAGPPRSGRPPTVALVTIDNGRLTPQIIELS
jgi:putative phosphoesterase